jgi:hypothetical protein
VSTVLDFVTEAGLAEYLDIVEKEVAAVKTDAWVLPTPPVESKPA